MSGQSGGYRLHLSTLNDQLTCKLCRGYFIDATTIIECLHSFCRSCIIKYLEKNKYCPICEVQVHKSKPLLNIRPDHTLQDIVYKLVPGCYQNEMRCRREFYSKYPDARSQVGSPESRGEPIESHIYSLDESLSLSLEYYIPSTKDQAEGDKESKEKSLPRRYLRCPAAVTVFHLQKLIRAKYGLSDAHRVDIMYKEEPLCGNYTLMDVMYIYHWRRKVPLHLSYRIFESSPKRLKLSEDNRVYEQILSNTRVDMHELKSELPEKREWKEVQLKISETGVMSVTDISTCEKKNVSNGNSVSGELVTVEKVELLEKGNTNEVVKERKVDDAEKSTGFLQNTAFTDNSAPKGGRNILPVQEMRRGTGDNDDNTNADTRRSRGDTPVPETRQDSSKAVKRSVTEGESRLGRDPTQKHGCPSKPKYNSMQEDSGQTKNGPEYSSTRKLENKTVNTNNNFINTGARVDSQKENSKSSGKEVRNASTSVETKQSPMQVFQSKVGPVNNTYAKKLPKEKKSVLINSRKLDSKLIPDQLKSEAKPLAHFANTKSQVTATISLTKLATSVVSSPQSTTMSTQTASTFVGVPQGSCLFVSTPQMTACALSNSAASSSPHSSPSPSKPVSLSPQNMDCQVAKTAHRNTSSGTPVNPELAGQKVRLPKNNNDNPASTVQSLASIGLNVSTSVPETNPNLSYAVQNLVSTSQVKNADLKNERQGPNASDARIELESVGVYSVAGSAIDNPCLSSPLTPGPSRRANSQPRVEIANVYTVPPCPDAIPISLMKPTVRKHEIIAKGTNLNEICAKIGESSKEKIKAATRFKPELPNLLKITKKTTADSIRSTPNVPCIGVSSSGKGFSPVVDKANDCIDKEPLKIGSTAATSALLVQTPVTLQKTCSVKKHSQQPVGYKTLRDPPKSWNPTLSKNNYVAARNQAKEMQNQSQGTSTSGGNGAKQIPSKPAKIFKMRNVPRYLGNPASGVKPMYGVSNESKDKDAVTQIVQKTTSPNMMTIDPKTLSPIVSTANSPVISPPPPYSPNARSYQNTQFSREICRNPGSPISPRNSPVNMLSTNPFIPSPTLNTNPRLIYTPFPPPFPDTSRFPNPLIRSPIGIPSPSAFHSSLPPSINKYQRASYHVPALAFSTSTPPTIQKILPSVHTTPKSPKSTTVNTSPMFTLGKADAQLPTRVENIALHLANRKNAAQQELNIFNLSKTGNPAGTHFSNLSTTNTTATTTTATTTTNTTTTTTTSTCTSTTTTTPTTTTTTMTSGYTLSGTLQNTTTQMTVRSKPQLEIEIPELDTLKPDTVDMKNVDKSSSRRVINSGTGADTTGVTDTENNPNDAIVKVNGEIATPDQTVKKEASRDVSPEDKVTSPVSLDRELPSAKEACEKEEKSVAINSEKASNDGRSEDAIRKSADQVQGKKSDVEKNKPES